MLSPRSDSDTLCISWKYTICAFACVCRNVCGTCVGLRLTGVVAWLSWEQAVVRLVQLHPTPALNQPEPSGNPGCLRSWLRSVNRFRKNVWLQKRAVWRSSTPQIRDIFLFPAFWWFLKWAEIIWRRRRRYSCFDLEATSRKPGCRMVLYKCSSFQLIY